LPLSLITAPVTLTLFTSRAEYKQYAKDSGHELDLTDKALSGSVCSVVVNNRVLVFIDPAEPPDEIRLSLVHESVHVWQIVREYMDIGYDKEVESYAIEAIFEELVRLCRSQGFNI
jgi:hypothetical protein